MPGSTAPRRSIWSSPWMMPPLRSTRRSWSRKRERRRVSAAWPTWWRRRACSAPSTPIGAAIISIRRRPAARCRGCSSPRSAGRSSSSASSNIAAYSPEARGRSERVFRTLQDRLPKELRLAGITGIEAANRWLAEVYLPEHNARFAVPAEQQGSAFVADRTGGRRDILCVQEERVVGNDNTVKWKRLSLQIPPSPLRPHFVRTKVRVHEYPDGRLAVFWGPHRLADYDPQGAIINAHALAA